MLQTFVISLFLPLQLDKYTANCDIINASLNRFKSRYFTSGKNDNARYSNYILRNPKTKGVIDSVELIMDNSRGCQKYPHENMDEHCK